MKVPKNLLRVIAGAVALAVSLAAGEGLFRKLSPTWRRMHGPRLPFLMEDPELGWRLKPGWRGSGPWQVPFRVNSLGFRGPEIAKEKPEGLFRVAVLGDSIVMGSGLTEEVLIPARLEQELKKLMPGRKIEVINAGVAGYDVVKERKFLAKFILPLKPDAVVLVVCLNDLPGVSAAEIINPLRDLPVPGKHWLLEHSALALTLQALYNRIGLREDSRVSRALAAEKNPPTAAKIERAYARWEEETARMKRACERAHAFFLAAIVPHAAQFEDPRKRFLPQKRLMEICRRLEITCLDPKEEFAARKPLPFIAPDPVHPSPEGHKLIAKMLAEQIAEAYKERP